MTSPSSLYPVLIGTLSCLLVGLFVLSLGIGQVWIDPTLLWSSIGDPSSAEAIILSEIRLPRAVLAVMIGAILGLSGAVLQGFLRNPLAEPGLLGISATASLGAVLAIYSGLTAFHAYALPLSALVGAFLAVFLLQALVGRTGDILTIILAGVALSSLSAALTSLILNMSTNPFAALEIVFWMMGSLADRSLVHISLAGPFIVVGGALLLSTAPALDALSLGADVAQSLGVSLQRTRTITILGTAIGVGAATAVAGAIGFVGLIVPHVLRPLVGQKPGRLLPASALGGAVFLLAADIFVRVIIPERDLKLGVVTAILGAPFFLWLLVSLRSRSS
ncbi:FecCD family ABC transporter permease [Roseibium sp.]|uniref:FecCD family ABC transporter permease n=1 Tax=Roseibium sp. TaxID=1936156 RepID=UPI003B513A85